MRRQGGSVCMVNYKSGATPQRHEPGRSTIPITTSLLAEVARRSKTIEVSPQQAEEAMQFESEASDDNDGPEGSLPASRTK